jgi:isopenicillin N synthase-like dioxygenase
LSQISIIDFQPFFESDAAYRQAVAKQIYQASQESGIMYLKNHGIPQTLIDKVFNEAKSFFSLPLEIKQQLEQESTAWIKHVGRGYVGIGRLSADPTKLGDLREGFDVGKEVLLENWSQVKYTSEPLWIGNQPNKWPPGQDGFRQDILDFFHISYETAFSVLRALALALQLPESFFVEKHDKKDGNLRLTHYPPLNQLELQPEQTRLREHVDANTITLLFQDEVGGLEVCTVQGEWISVPWISGAIIVNIGALMQRWTSDELYAPKHRVIIPNDLRSLQSRYFLGLFIVPNYLGSEIECIESLQETEQSPKYPPITLEDYFISLNHSK